jgi:hypothetical protein
MKTLAALAVCFAMPAFADTKCGGYADMAAALSKEFGEAQRFVGIDSRGLITVLFFNAETSSWKVLFVAPDGRACVIAAGVNGEFVAPGSPA